MTELERIRQEFAARMLAQGGSSKPSPQMSPVPDQQGQMSPENMALLRGQAAYDPGKREAILADQLRGGRDQIFAKGPQGKQMGNIYAAPTWSENLSGAVKKGLGGLEMARARKGLREVDDLRGVASEAEGQLGQIAEDERLTQQDAENQNRSAALGQGQERVNQGQARIDQAIADANTLDKYRSTQTKQDQQRIDETLRSNMADEEIARAEARIKAEAARLKASGKEMTPQERKRIHQEEQVFSNLSEGIVLAEELQSEGKDVGKPWSDVAIGVVENAFGEAAGNVATNMAYNADEQLARGKIDNSVEQYRRAFTGANLTEIEKRLGKNWDPTATGISTQAKIERSRALLDILNNNRDVFDLSMLEAPKGSGPRSVPMPLDPNDIPSVDTYEPDKEDRYQAWLKSQG